MNLNYCVEMQHVNSPKPTEIRCQGISTTTPVAWAISFPQDGVQMALAGCSGSGGSRTNGSNGVGEDVEKSTHQQVYPQSSTHGDSVAKARSSDSNSCH